MSYMSYELFVDPDNECVPNMCTIVQRPHNQFNRILYTHILVRRIYKFDMSFRRLLTQITSCTSGDLRTRHHRHRHHDDDVLIHPVMVCRRHRIDYDDNDDVFARSSVFRRYNESSRRGRFVLDRDMMCSALLLHFARVRQCMHANQPMSLANVCMKTMIDADLDTYENTVRVLHDDPTWAKFKFEDKVDKRAYLDTLLVVNSMIFSRRVPVSVRNEYFKHLKQNGYYTDAFVDDDFPHVRDSLMQEDEVRVVSAHLFDYYVEARNEYLSDYYYD